MDQCDVVEKPVLERIQNELEADPENGRISYDASSIAFTAKRRNSFLPAKTESNSAESQPQLQHTPGAEAAAHAFGMKPSLSVQPKGTPTVKPRGCSTLSLLSDSRKMEAQTPFVCDGKWHGHIFAPEQRVAVVGLGFAGPIDEDAFYDVIVEINDINSDKSLTEGTIEKSIFALKGETFYFLFDQPVQMERTSWNIINYSLKGPNTSLIVGGRGQDTTLQEGSNQFGLYFLSNQVSEILFKRL